MKRDGNSEKPTTVTFQAMANNGMNQRVQYSRNWSWAKKKNKRNRLKWDLDRWHEQIELKKGYDRISKIVVRSPRSDKPVRWDLSMCGRDGRSFQLKRVDEPVRLLWLDAPPLSRRHKSEETPQRRPEKKIKKDDGGVGEDGPKKRGNKKDSTVAPIAMSNVYLTRTLALLLHSDSPVEWHPNDNGDRFFFYPMYFFLFSRGWFQNVIQQRFVATRCLLRCLPSMYVYRVTCSPHRLWCYRVPSGHVFFPVLLGWTAFSFLQICFFYFFVQLEFWRLCESSVFFFLFVGVWLGLFSFPSYTRSS